MWSWLWRSRDRFSLDQLRYLTDQLQKIQIVNNVNKDFVVESLRSLSELLIYGDQHDSRFFEYFMEKQVTAEFVRILNISKTVSVSLQLLQTMSIIIQNLKSEHAIYYLFSNEHINSFITYRFEFHNDELLSFYISFLRAISGKLNTSTISLLVKLHDEQVVSFPLYVEAIRFAFHEENMIRTAVRAVTLNIYHVGDESVNRYIAEPPQTNYFSDSVKFLKKQCLNLKALVSESMEGTSLNAYKAIIIAVDDIEDHLYYFNDAISAGIPDLGRLLTEFLLQLLIFPILLPSLWVVHVNENIGAVVSMLLLCCVLRIVKYKDLANTVAASLFCRLEVFFALSESNVNSCASDLVEKVQQLDTTDSVNFKNRIEDQEVQPENSLIQNKIIGSSSVLRDVLLYYIAYGSEQAVTGSINLLATFLQTKELNENMLDALGILPQRKQHKKLLLKSLFGEGVGEEQLFSAESYSSQDVCSSDFDGHMQKLKENYGVMCSSFEVGTSYHSRRIQVLDVLVSLMSRTNISAKTLWDGGWLLRQLLPYGEAELESRSLKRLKDIFKEYSDELLREIRGDWADMIIPVLCEEWKKCKRVIEASSPRKDPKLVILSSSESSLDGMIGEISYRSGKRLCEVVKVFVLLCQLNIFSLGGDSLERPPLNPPIVNEISRARAACFDLENPKPGSGLRLVNAIPCRISFERGKERHLFFLAISEGTNGWMILAEESPSKEQQGIIRIMAPLAGSNPSIDEKHAKWLHLRVRLSSLPSEGKMQPQAVVDGRWTLAFRDEESCKSAVAMISEEIDLLRSEVERRLRPLMELQK